MKLRLALAAALTAIAAPALSDTPAPDYAQARYWSTVESLPQGASAARALRNVDVFWIHPTTTRSPTDLNHDPLDPAVLKWTEESAVQRQASAFSACCRVFAPRYRAATSKALMDPVNRDKAFALAYADVERAFDWYLAHENKGRPFIIAGHSQGGAHTASLLEKRIKGTKLQGRMVAAYIIGINLMEGDLAPRLAGIPFCDTPAQTGCFVQWNSVLAGSDNGPTLKAYAAAFAAENGGKNGGKPLCVNPVTFHTRRPLSLSSEARGTVTGDPGFGAMGPLKTGAVAAECRDGLLTVWTTPALGLKPLPGGSMHYHDVGLFWADISANAALRAQAWLKAHGSR
ncbi:Protein of unknown function (DUF3089) [Novosphingobium taihuense]|uniref:DUF3089 domain-containing protein n=1 Tax=Novosphingobium taihuense TaxID=260085 RepID=A0A7W7EVA4_9SPHN|nr:DUF3089 domain-containing protein [Novosphingobium taihuense]MBB4614839.1 hypothetical protein [Novosphingobium taihuense]TWH84719.1 Protein of unknown function (DUF3089) [Novosphingobium taihuense]